MTTRYCPTHQCILQPAYCDTLPPIRPLLVQLYASAYGCPPAADTDLSEQAAYLKFVLPSPAALKAAAVVLAEAQEGEI